jgi:GPH family glycoside/pentoside/hexuronide:cation symporter
MTSTERNDPPTAPPAGLACRFWYGFGQMAEGVIGASFEAFVFFYYSQVLGLSAPLCGLALLIAIFSDAITDPLVASVSDGWRSRWGRRHPFMMAAIVPLAGSLIGIFSPPAALGEWALFAWLTVCAVLLHATLTIYHIPHMALGAELTSDYVGRTRIVAYRAFFQLVSAGAVIPICFAVFFQPSEAFENGQLDPSSYPMMAIALASVASIAIAATSLGTWSRIPWLIGEQGEPQRTGLSRILSELAVALRSPNYRALFGGFLVLLVGRSITGVLGVHLLTYYWLLSPDEIMGWGTVGLVGSLVGVPAWAGIAPRVGKKETLLIGLGVSSLALAAPPLLHLVGLFPARESPLFFGAILLSGFLAQFMWAANMVVVGSMIADLADEYEMHAGRRQEGILFAGLSFSYKLARALAVQVAGLATAWLGLEAGIDPEEIAGETARSIALLYGLPTLLFTGLSLAALSFYSLSEEDVRGIQRAAEERRASEA